MARTQIAAAVRESLVNRLAIYYLSNQETRIEQTVWTLRTVGFDEDVVNAITNDAWRVAGLPESPVTPVQIGPDRKEPVGTGETDKPAEPAGGKARPVTPAPKPA